MTQDNREMLLVLASRVEGLSGPSAEERQGVIDAYNLIFPPELSLTEEQRGDEATRFRRIMRRCDFTTFINTDYHAASIDAAMMLVPKAWVIGQMSWWPEDRSATVHMDNKYGLKACSGAETLSLALTAAAIRARAASC